MTAMSTFWNIETSSEMNGRGHKVLPFVVFIAVKYDNVRRCSESIARIALRDRCCLDCKHVCNDEILLSDEKASFTSPFV